TKDDVPVVLHDIHIDTVTDVADTFPRRKRKDGRFYAIDFTLAELMHLRVTERFHPKTRKSVYPQRFPTWQSRFQIATLAEEIEMIQGLNHTMGRDVGLYVEIKNPAWHQTEGKDITKIVHDTLT